MGRARPPRLSSKLATIFAWYSLCERGTQAGASETTRGGEADIGNGSDVNKTAGDGRGDAGSLMGVRPWSWWLGFLSGFSDGGCDGW